MESGIVPRCNLEREKAIYDTVVKLINEGLISGAFDCSRGGLGVAIAKMCIKNNIGAEIHLKDYNINNLREDALLFSETSGRIILSVKEKNKERVINALGKNRYIIGRIGGDYLKIINKGEGINLNVKEMTKVYENSFYGLMGETNNME